MELRQPNLTSNGTEVSHNPLLKSSKSSLSMTPHLKSSASSLSIKPQSYERPLPETPQSAPLRILLPDLSKPLTKVKSAGILDQPVSPPRKPSLRVESPSFSSKAEFERVSMKLAVAEKRIQEMALKLESLERVCKEKEELVHTLETQLATTRESEKYILCLPVGNSNRICNWSVLCLTLPRCISVKQTMK